MKNDLFLCVDIGQSRLKIAIYNSKLKPLYENSTDLETIQVENGYAERDMDYLWKQFYKLIKIVLVKNKFFQKNLSYICITGHGDGLFPIDKNGMPVRNAIISIDTRARNISDQFNKKHKKKLLKYIGQLTTANNPAMIIKWLIKNEKNTVKKSRWFLYCKDWINYKLTGRISTDFSSASAGLTNVKNGKYDDQIFEMYGFSKFKEKFPNIEASNSTKGLLSRAIKKRLLLSKDVKVLEGLHDISAAMIGMNSLDENKLLLIGGTFGISQILSDKMIVNENILCRTSFNKKKWLHVAFTPSCASSINWMLDILNLKILNLNTLITNKLRKGGNNIVFVPYLYGGQTGRTGYGKFNYIMGGHNSEDLILSTIEGVVFSLANQILFLNKYFKINEIIATGGIFKIKIISQLLANITNKKIYLYDNTEAGVLGCAITCLSSLNNGYIEDNKLILKKKLITRPNKFMSKYLEIKYKIFLKEEAR